MQPVLQVDKVDEVALFFGGANRRSAVASAGRTLGLLAISAGPSTAFRLSLVHVGGRKMKLPCYF